MTDLLSERCGDLLTGSYDCPDRIVLNAYYSMGHAPGGFRVWWRRWHDDGDEQLDNAHLMRLAGRFARRLRASAQAHGIPVIDCKAGERKHQIAEEYLAEHPEVRVGVFLILVNRSPATVWKVDRSAKGVIHHLEKTRQFVNHYSFHIIDPTWGHVTIKISGHPPFGAQVMLNGHEYVAAAARSAGIGFTKEGNCFTQVSDPERLAQIADTLSQPGIVGRLSQVIDRWIYSACLCYGLNIDEQEQSGFRYDYSVYQVEYSRNLVFASGAVMDRLFNTMVDRTRSRLDVPKVRTLFGSKGRPHRKPGQELSDRQAVVIEKPRWNLTIFKVHFGLLDAEGVHQRRTRPALRGDRASHQTARLRPQTGQVPADHRPADRHGRPLHQHARLRRARVPARRDPRPAARTLHARRNPDRRPGHQRPPGSCRARRNARAGGRPGRIHRRRVHRQSTGDDRTDPRGLQRPPGRLRPAQAPRQTARHQTRPNPPLPRPRARRTHASPRYSPSATRSSRPSPPGSAHHDEAAHPRTGPPSTATTKPSAATCKTLLNDLGIATKATPHRQRFVDRVSQPSSYRTQT